MLRPSSAPRRPWAVLTAVLLLAGCSAIPDEPPEPDDPQPSHEADPQVELARFYEQAPVWEECVELAGLECASVEVPLDYDDPEGESIELALARRPGEGGELGSLVLNPGGPGSSGVELVEVVAETWGAEVLSAYDVVGFDPRGVARSEPVDCLGDAELDEIRASEHDPGTEEGMAAARREAEEVAVACEAATGELLAHLDTRSAARDMDVLRAVLGQERLNYVGYSYGTYLGATYAELFPERVGRLVLDGALDPALSRHELAFDQAIAFEAAFARYVEDCLAWSECPLDGDVDQAVESVRVLLEELRAAPLPVADGRELTAGLAASGIIAGLYHPAFWGPLSEALGQVLRAQDGTGLLFLADNMVGRLSDGSYAGNSMEANWAVNCLDRPAEGDAEDWRERAEELAEAAPTFGPTLAYSEILCDAWPVPAEGTRGPVSADGSGPILVVGTTGDPATPYAWSERLAAQLASGVLLTYEGEGHTAYGRTDDPCLNEAVNAYLLRGQTPEDGLTC